MDKTNLEDGAGGGTPIARVKLRSIAGGEVEGGGAEEGNSAAERVSLGEWFIRETEGEWTKQEEAFRKARMAGPVDPARLEAEIAWLREERARIWGTLKTAVAENERLLAGGQTADQRTRFLERENLLLYEELQRRQVDLEVALDISAKNQMDALRGVKNREFLVPTLRTEIETWLRGNRLFENTLRGPAQTMPGDRREVWMERELCQRFPLALVWSELGLFSMYQRAEPWGGREIANRVIQLVAKAIKDVAREIGGGNEELMADNGSCFDNIFKVEGSRFGSILRESGAPPEFIRMLGQKAVEISCPVSPLPVFLNSAWVDFADVAEAYVRTVSHEARVKAPRGEMVEALIKLYHQIVERRLRATCLLDRMMLVLKILADERLYQQHLEELERLKTEVRGKEATEDQLARMRGLRRILGSLLEVGTVRANWAFISEGLEGMSYHRAAWELARRDLTLSPAYVEARKQALFDLKRAENPEVPGDQIWRSIDERWDREVARNVGLFPFEDLHEGYFDPARGPRWAGRELVLFVWDKLRRATEMVEPMRTIWEIADYRPTR